MAMKRINNHIFLIASIVFLSISSSSYGLECKNPCHCDISDDKVLDLSKVNGTLYNGNIVYHFFGCKNKNYNGCGDTTLCLEDNTNKTKWVNLGDEKSATVKFSGTSYELVFSLNGMTSRIILVCAPNLKDNIMAVNQTIANTTNPILYSISEHACVQQVNHAGLSTGSKLVIIVLVLFIAYFVGGSVVLYFIRGARGKEMIPNYEFWQSLPGLMKDGLVFILNGCRPTSIATAETYDRI